MGNMTKHARYERRDRLNYIIDNIGIGEPICTAPSKNPNAISVLTNTGIIIIKGKTDNVIITVYIATIAEATAIYYQSGMTTPLPQRVKKRIRINKEELEKRCI